MVYTYGSKGVDFVNTQDFGKFIAELEAAIGKDEVTKEEIVSIMKAYLPNFDHIETGKSLDSKM